MQKKRMLLILLLCNSIYCQIINIPDPNFKAILLEADYDNSIAGTGLLSNLLLIKIDQNDDGEIEVSEVQNISYLLIPTSNISDLTGIEYFSNLRYFFCFQNNLTTLDNITELTQIERIFCNQNQITSLNLSNFSQLRTLGCWNNQITSLDFSNNPALEIVYCENNLISTLDFTANPLFNDLGCKNSPNLTTLKINNGAEQLFGAQTLYNQCWTNCPNLTTICADDNEISALQSYLIGCGITQPITITRDCSLGVIDEYGKDDVIVFPNPSTGIFTINTKKEAVFEVYNLLGKIILKQDVFSNLDTIIDLSNYNNGIYFLKIMGDITCETVKIIKR